MRKTCLCKAPPDAPQQRQAKHHYNADMNSYILEAYTAQEMVLPAAT